LKEKLFCKNFGASNLVDSISISAYDYSVHVAIFSNHEILTINGVEHYHHSDDIFLTLEEFIEDEIKEKCAEKYKSLIRERKLTRITDDPQE